MACIQQFNFVSAYLPRNQHELRQDEHFVRHVSTIFGARGGFFFKFLLRSLSIAFHHWKTPVKHGGGMGNQNKAPEAHDIHGSSLNGFNPLLRDCGFTFLLVEMQGGLQLLQMSQRLCRVFHCFQGAEASFWPSHRKYLHPQKA